MMEPDYYLGKPIESLQTMLREIAAVYPQILPVIPNGVYNRNTFAAVQSFQRMVGLPPNGIATPGTWAAIADLFHQIYPFRTPPDETTRWPAGKILRPEEASHYLYLAQGMLAALCRLFPACPKPELSGVLDSKTQQGLIWLQRAAGLEQTGWLDTQTWYYLNHLYRTMADP